MENSQPPSRFASAVGWFLFIAGLIMMSGGIVWAVMANAPANRGNEFYGIGVAMGIGAAIFGGFFALLGLIVVVLAQKPRKTGVKIDDK